MPLLALPLLALEWVHHGNRAELHAEAERAEAAMAELQDQVSRVPIELRERMFAARVERLKRTAAELSGKLQQEVIGLLSRATDVLADGRALRAIRDSDEGTEHPEARAALARIMNLLSERKVLFGLYVDGETDRRMVWRSSFARSQGNLLPLRSLEKPENGGSEWLQESIEAPRAGRRLQVGIERIEAPFVDRDGRAQGPAIGPALILQIPLYLDPRKSTVGISGAASDSAADALLILAWRPSEMNGLWSDTLTTAQWLRSTVRGEVVHEAPGLGIEAESAPKRDPDTTVRLLGPSHQFEVDLWAPAADLDESLRPLEAVTEAAEASSAEVHDRFVAVSTLSSDGAATLRMSLIATVVLTLAVSAVLLVGMGRRIRNLMRAIDQRRREGTAWVPEESDPRDEIDWLGQSLMRTLAQVADRDQRLRGHTDQLEQRVLDRTAKLEEARSEAERAAEAKSEFLARMSHELRTPLHGMLSLTGLARDKAEGEVHEHLEELGACGEHLLGLINQLLDFQKLAHAAVVFEKLPFTPQELVRGPLSAMRHKARETGVGFSVVLDEALPEALAGDGARIRQVLLNLAGNALKFTSEGEVCVALKALPSAAGPDHVVLRAEVRDTGPGIVSERREAIFESFVQESAATSRHHGGTGLGLSISQHLIEHMGGQIGVTSTVGEGSTFWFELPLERCELPAAHPAAGALAEAASQAAAKASHVLVVDDNATNRRVARLILEGAGHSVVEACDGEEALAQLASPTGAVFDLALLDLEMPGLSGYEVLTRFRAAEERSGADRLEIFVLSGHGDAETGVKVEAAGGDGLLAKPFRPAELLRLIARS